MSVEFYRDENSEHRWHIVEDDEDHLVEPSSYDSGRGDLVLHTCHEGFHSESSALQNLLENHALMGIFVTGAAKGYGKGVNAGGIHFDETINGSVNWKIKSDKTIIGQSCKDFDNSFDAVNNLIITYTMLAMFVAQIAQLRLTS